MITHCGGFDLVAFRGNLSWVYMYRRRRTIPFFFPGDRNRRGRVEKYEK